MHRRYSAFEGALLTRTSNIVPAVIHPQLSYTSYTTKQLSPEAALSAPFQVQANMVRISDEVEINRSPADVRAVVRTPRVSSFLLLVLTELCMTAPRFPELAGVAEERIGYDFRAQIWAGTQARRQTQK